MWTGREVVPSSPGRKKGLLVNGGEDGRPAGRRPIHLTHSYPLLAVAATPKGLGWQAWCQLFPRVILCLIRPFLVVGAGVGQVGGVFPASRHPKPNGGDRQSRS
jgi:hypothetical protein